MSVTLHRKKEKDCSDTSYRDPPHDVLKKREIFLHVRKVLGASVTSIVVLFTQSYVRLLLIACVIGIPLAYYVLRLWIDNFAYKADIGWIIFVVPVFTVSLMAWLAVSLQVVKAALMNPVHSLRHE